MSAARNWGDVMRRFPWRKHEPVSKRSASEIMRAALEPRSVLAEFDHALRLHEAKGYARGYSAGSSGLPFDPRVFDLIDETAERLGLPQFETRRLFKPERNGVSPTLH